MPSLGLLPDTLRGRLTLLLVLAVLASHVLALSLMFELRPQPPQPPGMSAPPPGPPPAQAGPGPGPRGLLGMLQAPAPLRWGLVLDIAVRLAALAAAAWWAARWLTRPVQRLAEAAQALGQEGATPPVPEEGPREFRQASRVFNQMQARIRQQLAERDRFVAAVSHDLRTPLTRLRLRTEALAQASERERMGRDIAEMDAMITATLEHLRGAAHAEPLAKVDVRALIDSMADDYLDTGHEIAVDGRCAPLQVRPGALRRCLDNLVGNALRYGGGAQVSVLDLGTAVRITVRDHGPGLPAQELASVMEPFYRVEPSRNRASGGMGLGLSIARDIALRHGGTLVLRNATGGGLEAVLELPRPR
ncbi:MAG: HAMP domain-containing protein [Burkholderiales bacterium]|nr:HAMP domain-containing protein [Burkholderiales bacterium]